MSERDYAADMRAVIDAETANGPYNAAEVAAHVVKKLRATDPDLLLGFLERQAEYLVRQMIIQRDCSTRTHARTHARRNAFGAAAREAEQGQPEKLVKWLEVPFPVQDGTRKRLADLRADDLDFVASDYEHRANENALTASFLRALQRKVGRGTVGAKFSDDQLNRMWNSLVGGSA